MFEDADIAGMVLVAIFIKPFVESLQAHRYLRAVGVACGLVLVRVVLEFVRLGDEFSLLEELAFQTLVNGGSFLLVAMLFFVFERWIVEKKEP